MDSRPSTASALRRPPAAPPRAPQSRSDTQPPAPAPGGLSETGVTSDREPGSRGDAGRRLGDRRGLSALGALLLAVVLTSLGGVVDVLTGSGLRAGFALAFLTACVLTAALVHREDLVAAVVLPPLLYVGVATGAMVATTAVSGGLARQSLELATQLVLGAPVLVAGTALALGVAFLRGAVATSRRRSARR